MHTSTLARASHIALAVTLFFLVIFSTFISATAANPAQAGRIAFVGNQSGSWQLYTMNPDGSAIVQLTDLQPTDWEIWAPHISPDGKSILFTYGIADVNGNLPLNLYVINVDGTGLTEITNDGLSLFPIWSQDGTKIAFCHVSTRTGLCVLTTMPADGKGQQTALTTDLWDSLPASYTPDGNQIMFGSRQGGFISAVWIMNADGSNQRRLTAPQLKASPVDISPDGKHITFTNNQNSPTTLSIAIFVMDINGTHIRQLTHPGPHHDLGGVYSPDGSQLVFASDRATSDTSLDIYTSAADGTNIARVATGLTIGGCPDDNCVNANWGPTP